jgi:hypothetical protein
MADQPAVEMGQHMIGGLHVVEEAGEVLAEGAAAERDDVLLVRRAELCGGYDGEVEGRCKIRGGRLDMTSPSVL